MVATEAKALDGEVSFAAVENAIARAYPSDESGSLEGIALIELGHNINQFRLFTSVETLLNNLGADNGVHPSSARFIVGAEYNLKNGLFIGAEHMCWHPIDRDGHENGSTEQYNMIKVGWRFGR